ncbi:MAG: hypothetical protein EPGJADBJ_02631 [Saprospiraceae bacterium]|nr:hypothetical protein [Saprospiraceae bacterium]
MTRWVGKIRYLFFSRYIEAWHLEHRKNCSCRRGFPKKLVEEMKKRGIPVPE